MQADENSINKILGIMRGFAFIIVLLHCYYFCYSLLYSLGVTHSIFDKFLLGLHHSNNLFNSELTTKIFALIILILSSLGREKKDRKTSWNKILSFGIAGLILYFGNFFLLSPTVFPSMGTDKCIIYIISLIGGFLLLMSAFTFLARMLKRDLMKDRFNTLQESFLQTEEYMYNDRSINLPTEYIYMGKKRKGWINVVNPFRATIVLGTPGSGKSFAVINNYIKQHIEKGFAMYIYDYKFPDLSHIAYNHFLNHQEGYIDAEGNGKIPRFCVINFDDPSRSHRCNPIHRDFMTDISDAYESAYTIMLNLNKTWIQKQGDFFVESPIILFSAVIWFLKIYSPTGEEEDRGKYCTVPHAIELLNKKYTDIFPILQSYKELENYMGPFVDALEGGAQDQLQGQIASAKIPLSRMISPQLYWVMTGNDFTLDLNNPSDPKILVVGNNPDRQNIYSAALGLYNSRIVKTINKKKKQKCSVIIDELPTMYFRGLDNLIATARSHKVSVCLGFQDFSQLVRDYGDKEAKPIINTVGNLFSGLVVGTTAEELSKRFGKIKQEKSSLSINKSDTSESISTQMDTLIPSSKISTLSQGAFVGSVSDDFGQEIDQKFFHARIVVDVEKVADEEKVYKPIPIITPFIGEDGRDIMKESVEANYYRIKSEVSDLVEDEINRIMNDPKLCALIKTS